MGDDLNRAVRDTLDRKAEFWAARMGDGNLFQRELLGPANEQLLEIRAAGRGTNVRRGRSSNGVWESPYFNSGLGLMFNT